MCQLLQIANFPQHRSRNSVVKPSIAHHNINLPDHDLIPINPAHAFVQFSFGPSFHDTELFAVLFVDCECPAFGQHGPDFLITADLFPEFVDCTQVADDVAAGQETEDNIVYFVGEGG